MKVWDETTGTFKTKRFTADMKKDIIADFINNDKANPAGKTYAERHTIKYMYTRGLISFITAYTRLYAICGCILKSEMSVSQFESCVKEYLS
jgi:hypothetical protein